MQRQTFQELLDRHQRAHLLHLTVPDLVTLQTEDLTEVQPKTCEHHYMNPFRSSLFDGRREYLFQRHDRWFRELSSHQHCAQKLVSCKQMTEVPLPAYARGRCNFHRSAR